MALLAQPVHVDLVAEQIGHGVDIGGETSQAEVGRRGVVEDLGEVVGDGQGLHAQPQVTGDGDAVLAHHGDTGTAIWRELLVHREFGHRGYIFGILMSKGED